MKESMRAQKKEKKTHAGNTWKAKKKIKQTTKQTFSSTACTLLRMSVVCTLMHLKNTLAHLTAVCNCARSAKAKPRTLLHNAKVAQQKRQIRRHTLEGVFRLQSMDKSGSTAKRIEISRIPQIPEYQPRNLRKRSCKLQSTKDRASFL